MLLDRPRLSTRPRATPTTLLRVNQAKSSFNIFLNILSSLYVSGYYLQTIIFLHTYNLKDVYVLQRLANRLCLLLEFLGVSAVSDSSPHVREIRSLRFGWSAVALWRGQNSHTCMGSAPHSPGSLVRPELTNL
jgi:hypothetical protein